MSIGKFGLKYCKFLIFGEEIIPSVGTLHLHAYFNLLRRMNHATLKIILGDFIWFYNAVKMTL